MTRCVVGGSATCKGMIKIVATRVLFADIFDRIHVRHRKVTNDTNRVSQ